MKIAFVSQPFDRLNPGIQNSVGLWTYEIARRLASDASVTVYMAEDPVHRRIRDHDGMHFKMVPARMGRRVARLVDKAHRRPMPPPFLSPLYFAEYALRVSLELRRNPHDIVHVYNFPYHPRVIKAVVPDSRVVLNMTGGWLSRPLPASVERGLENVDLFLGCSKHITKEMALANPAISGRCRTAYNGTDLPPEGHGMDDWDAQRVLFVGRISPEKGVHILIEAFRKVVDDFGEATLELVGSKRQLPPGFLIDLSSDPQVRSLSRFYGGPTLSRYAQILQGRIRELDLEENVRMTGFLRHDEVLKRCRRAHVLANPSFSESFGLAVIEAMASGTPVVASGVGGMLETVAHGKTGYLVRAGDPEALAGRIKLLLENPSLRRRMGKKGRERVFRRFTWDKIAESVFELYEELVESHA